MKVIILGKTGFIGSALSSNFHSNPELQISGINSRDIDLTKDSSANYLAKIFCPETILVISVRAPKISPPQKQQEEDIAIINNICHALTLSPVKKCIYFSSISVYGENDSKESINETTPALPSSNYGNSRLEGEKLLIKHSRKQNIPLLILRPCMIYGPGNREFSYGPDKFIQSIFKSRVVELFGKGEELRDYLYIKDLVKITKTLMLKDFTGTFNLVSGKSYSFNDIINFLQNLTEETFEIVHLQRKKLKIDQSFDNSNLIKAISNFQFTPLEKGLSETIQNLKLNRTIL